MNSDGYSAGFFTLKVLGPHLPGLCDSMLSTALFDREINVRRAAAAAFQVGTSCPLSPDPIETPSSTKKFSNLYKFYHFEKNIYIYDFAKKG